MKTNFEFNNKPLTFVDALFLVFLSLKLSGAIQWSWVWVFSPIWISLIFIVVTLVFWHFVTK